MSTTTFIVGNQCINSNEAITEFIQQIYGEIRNHPFFNEQGSVYYRCKQIRIHPVFLEDGRVYYKCIINIF